MRTLSIFALFAGVAVVPTGVRAQEAADVAELLEESIVSTPSKNIETAAHAATTVSIITAEDMRRYGVRTLDEALNYLTHSLVVSDPNHAKEVGARGVLMSGDYNNHILLLLNGHVLNEAWDGAAYVDMGLGVPFELIDHIEVTLGPGSVMYGSEAMLGVINVVTRKAGAYRGVTTVTELSTAAPVGRAGNFNLSQPFGHGARVGLGYGAELQILGKPAELVMAAEWRARARPAFEVGPQWATDSVTLGPKNFGSRTAQGAWGGWIKHSRQERAPSAFAQLTVGDFSLWTRAAEYYRQSAYLDSTLDTAGDFDDPRNLERDRWFNIEAQQRLMLHRRSTLLVRGFTDLYQYRWVNAMSSVEDCPTQMTRGCTQRMMSQANNYGVELRSTTDWTNSGQFVTLVGAETKYRQIESSFDNLNGPRINSYAKSEVVLAAYAEQKFLPVTELDITLGARVDHYAGFGVAASPRASFGLQPWHGARWKNVYSTAFRAPSFYERYYTDTTQTAQIQNPNLRPEKVWSLESSLEQRLGAQRLLFGVFVSRWSGLVQYATLTESELERAIDNGSAAPNAEFGYQYRNTATLQSQGLEVRMDGHVSPRLTYGASLTLAHANVDWGDGSPSAPLTVTPSVYGNARVAYQWIEGAHTISLATRFEQGRYADRAFDGEFRPAPHVPPRVDLKLTLTGPLGSTRGLSYRFGGSYSLARVGPYVIGPNLYAVDSSTRAELSPVDRLQVFVGIEYAPERR